MVGAIVTATPSSYVRRVLKVVAGSFEQGRAELDQLTPAGWRRLHVIVSRT